MPQPVEPGDGGSAGLLSAHTKAVHHEAYETHEVFQGVNQKSCSTHWVR